MGKVIQVKLNIKVLIADKQRNKRINIETGEAKQKLLIKVYNCRGTLDKEKVIKPNNLLYVPLPRLPIFGPDEIRHKKRKLMSVEDDHNNVTSASDGGKEVEETTGKSLATGKTIGGVV